MFSKCSVAALGCQALFFNMMTCSTGRFPEEKFCSPGSTKCILEDLCFNSRPPSVLSWFPFFYEGEHPTGLHKGLSFSVMSLSLCSSLTQMCSWTQSYRGHFRAYGKGVLTFRGIQGWMLGSTGQLSRLFGEPAELRELALPSGRATSKQ